MTLDPERLNAIVRSQATVSDKVRALNAAGVPRADIARLLGKRYQHVRNVLEGDAQSGGYVVGRADLSGVNEAAAPFERDEDDKAFVDARSNGIYRLVVRPDGSILLPKAVAKAFQAGPGGVVMAQLEGDDFRIVSAATSARRVQEWVRQLNIPPGVSMADELIAERHAEAEREMADDD